HRKVRFKLSLLTLLFCRRKHCWVCFLNEDESEEEWVRPCRCRGTAKWIHQQCLQRWIDEKQSNNSSKKVACSQCNTEYILLYPPCGPFVYILEYIDYVLYQKSPFACVLVSAVCVYWSAFSYGVATVLHVMGIEEGKIAIEKADALTLLFVVPSIPIMLIIGRCVKWEDQFLSLWIRHYKKIPFLSYFVQKPPEKYADSGQRMLARYERISNARQPFRTVIGALLLPPIATVVGRYLFPRVSSNVYKSLLGGLTFIVVKGVFKIYLRQQQFIRQATRRVLNFTEDKLNDVHNSNTSSLSHPNCEQ
ncbi:hypothetical protein B4U80_10874, partial [Leptotrombidium deliense]